MYKKFAASSPMTFTLFHCNEIWSFAFLDFLKSITVYLHCRRQHCGRIQEDHTGQAFSQLQDTAHKNNMKLNKD